VIVWINGTFGVGKTTTAHEVIAQRSDARIWDPEFVGYMLQSQLEDLPVLNFQDWPAWRELVVATGAALVRQTGQVLVAPQTVLDEGYLREIRDGFRALGLPLFEVLLDAPAEVLRDRITGDSAGAPERVRDWRLRHVAPYLEARNGLLAGADLVLETTAMSPAEVAKAINAAT
jgi:hypothetical protein